jgi:hypothetical protein
MDQNEKKVIFLYLVDRGELVLLPEREAALSCFYSPVWINLHPQAINASCCQRRNSSV